ncbi:uncharacterized protein LOC123315353 [Coccinella septempunctata]|uniref:uncharacterized protein LOC123315353 n=2 Tax=Coccinella septempunctata TaxID=41139 RepID=UPI001D0600A5|nr:uncharacterized protein LOC123315353 [Coccinella septempunctata]
MSDNFGCLYGSATDSVSSRQVQTMKEKTLRLVLQFEIMVTVTKITRMEADSSRLWQSLSVSFPQEMLGRFLSYQNRTYDRRFALIKERNLRKVRALSEDVSSRVRPQERWVKNISTTDVPSRVLDFLALGPKFSIDIPMKHISLQRLLSDVEYTININDSLTEEGKDVKRSLAANIVTNYMKPNKQVKNIFQREFFHCKRYLREHSELLVLKSDKGNVTVVMDRSQYMELSNNILLDHKYYEILPRDPTTTIQKKCNSFIKKMVTDGHITQNQGKLMYNYSSVPARFYGLPKVHKPTLSLRPIISSINTPTSRLSVFISEILSSYLSANRSSYFVEDSFSFSEFIDGFQLPEGYVLISLDVVSLFSNISVELAVLAVETRWEAIGEHTSLPKNEFISIVRFLFASNYFTFNGRIYKQVLGSPMGSNFSPSIAEVVMDFIVDCILGDIPFIIPFLKKYVDDLIAAVPEDKVAFIRDRFNRQHECIKFTVEEETDMSVSFLDTKVMRTPQNRLMLDWYRKPSSSGRYLHFCSNHPHRQKVNMVLGLKNRIQKIAHPTLRHNNLKILFGLMRENGYPEGLLKRLIYNATPSGQPQNGDSGASTSNTQMRTIYSSIPYVRGMTHALVNLLKTPNLHVVSRSEFRIDRLYSRTKDRIDVGKMSGVVYRIPCSMCDKVYVGQTSQQLKQRISQHKSDTKNPNKICALADHVRLEDHVMGYDSADVLEWELNTRKRCFLESYHIKRQTNSMNFKKDIEGVSSIYAYLIHFDLFSESGLSIVR